MMLTDKEARLGCFSRCAWNLESKHWRSRSVESMLGSKSRCEDGMV